MNSETFREQGRCSAEFCFFLVRVRHRTDSLRRAREVRGERTEADLNEIELEASEGKARELGCCKLTLEVMDNNHRALRMYQAAGFVRYALQKDAGTAIFMSKPLH